MHIIAWFVVAYLIGSFIYSHRFHSQDTRRQADSTQEDPVLRDLRFRHAGRIGAIQGIKLAIAIVIAYNLLFGVWSR